MTTLPDFKELINAIPDALEFSLEINNEKMIAELNAILDSTEDGKEFESLESIKLRLLSQNLSNDELMGFLANQISWNEVADWHNEELKKLNKGLSKLLEYYSEIYKKTTNAHNYVQVLNGVSNQITNTASFLEGQISGRDAQKVILARKGALSNRARYEPLKKLAANLVNSRNFKSRRNAARTIMSEVVAESERLNINLSRDQAEITITGWLKELGLPANISP